MGDAGGGILRRWSPAALGPGGAGEHRAYAVSCRPGSRSAHPGPPVDGLLNVIEQLSGSRCPGLRRRTADPVSAVRGLPARRCSTSCWPPERSSGRGPGDLGQRRLGGVPPRRHRTADPGRPADLELSGGPAGHPDVPGSPGESRRVLLPPAAEDMPAARDLHGGAVGTGSGRLGERRHLSHRCGPC